MLMALIYKITYMVFLYGGTKFYVTKRHKNTTISHNGMGHIANTNIYHSTP